MSPCEPATNTGEDKLAAERADAITNLWFLEPALKGRYPEALAILPDAAWGVKSADLDKMRAPFDFIGINLYYRTIASASGAIERMFHPQEWLFPVKVTGGISRDFNRPVIEITESGCAYNDSPDAGGAIHDARRIDYHRQYLHALARAVTDGADVRGYHAWSLIDNLEWAEGFSQRFGLAYVDFQTQQRSIKESGRWYAKVAEKNALPSTQLSF
jgi:beta-glucosidase